MRAPNACPNAPNHNRPPTTTTNAHLDDQRRVEGVLEPLGELEGDEVAEVERLGGGPAPGVEVEALAGLKGVEELDEVAGECGWFRVVRGGLGLERSIYRFLDLRN